MPWSSTVRINADFTRRVVVRPVDYRWVDSPMQGVERMMLDRIGDEVARATSLVRYAPNTAFPPHVHGGGEEFFVLDGVFGDEHRSYPAGAYVRNPVGTSHAPRVADQGCVIFVKLHQFDPADHTPVAVETRGANWPPPVSPGIEELRLHRFGSERVSLMRWAPGAQWASHGHDGGEEIFVIDGAFSDEHGDYPAGTWLRLPHGSRHEAHAGTEGAFLYLKKGHLPVAA